ncbi:hypothetical protein V2L07_05280 [Pseudomonas alliivorans]|uniref:hypothetical protein n=1 Tax=Pseudomonas alliivorans TaxID=2810613 RepID=UPI001F3ABD85|nr:hypothetical protein [Pseudomonas alliivorans]MEE4572195.1 hypothetical protein [Pseudomonas alliivorans]MEE4625485.1 hypothetical protein [Pseudomonas alliivorans]MEE4685278.1 hypothetical protein [Pseudomonas alliivorans]MEE5038247.1 hypothetical protein [Pseudomonas alliivorans]
MSRTGARDKARRQLTETLALLSESAALLSKSRSLIERIETSDAAQYLAELEDFCSRPIPAEDCSGAYALCKSTWEPINVMEAA